MFYRIVCRDLLYFSMRFSVRLKNKHVFKRKLSKSVDVFKSLCYSSGTVKKATAMNLEN